MSVEQGLVGEFREIVDKVIEQHESTGRGVMRLGARNVVNAVGLTFGSFDRRDGRR